MKILYFIFAIGIYFPTCLTFWNNFQSLFFLLSFWSIWLNLFYVKVSIDLWFLKKRFGFKTTNNSSVPTVTPAPCFPCCPPLFLHDSLVAYGTEMLGRQQRASWELLEQRAMESVVNELCLQWRQLLYACPFAMPPGCFYQQEVGSVSPTP